MNKDYSQEQKVPKKTTKSKRRLRTKEEEQEKSKQGRHLELEKSGNRE